MITVKLVRSGTASKKYGVRRNTKGNGAFWKTFKDIEELVWYFRNQHCAVYFSPDFDLPPDLRKQFISKYRALLNKKIPGPDAKVEKALVKMKKKYAEIGFYYG